jgi:hypothetical protein
MLFRMDANAHQVFISKVKPMQLSAFLLDQIAKPFKTKQDGA